MIRFKQRNSKLTKRYRFVIKNLRNGKKPKVEYKKVRCHLITGEL